MIYPWSAADTLQARDVALAKVIAQFCSHVKKDRDFTPRDADTNKVLDTKAVKLVRTLMAAPPPRRHYRVDEDQQKPPLRHRGLRSLSV